MHLAKCVIVHLVGLLLVSAHTPPQSTVGPAIAVATVIGCARKPSVMPDQAFQRVVKGAREVARLNVEPNC